MRREELARRCGAVALLLGVLVVLAAPIATAQTTQTGTSAEAWHQGSVVDDDAPFCILPCPQLAFPTNPYPEHTLHVGVSGGREVARTAFTLDLSPLPPGAVPTGGTVTLPAAGAEGGTSAAELADMVACLVDGPVEPAEGGEPQDAPEADCTVSAPVEPVDGEEETFSFDLAPLVASYPGVGDLSLAVLPSDAAREEAQTWRVAFHGRDSDAPDAQPITAEILYGGDEPFEPATGSFDPPADADFGPAPEESFDGGVGDTSGFDAPQAADVEIDDGIDAPDVADADAEEPEVAADEPMTGVPVTAGYAYAGVWLLPLAFLGAGVLLTRSLAQDYEVELPDDSAAA